MNRLCLKAYIREEIPSSVIVIGDRTSSAIENDCSCGGEISLGPWGYQTGVEWTFQPQLGIKYIIIRHGGIIDSIVFRGAIDGDYSTKIGGEGGNRTVKIDIDFPAEFLTGISGTIGKFWSLSEIVCSLKFQTNRAVYGPYGTECGAEFSSNTSNGSVITGFHGRLGKFVDAIGVYVKPVCSIDSSRSRLSPPPRSARAWGGEGGREWDDGVFSAVSAVHVCVRVDTAVVTGVGFSYVKRDGSEFISPFHGDGCGGDEHREIVFDEKDEFLIGIEGFVGGLDGIVGVNVVRSLTFVTNKAKYGPIGAEIGTHFATVNSGDCNRKVVRFHGRSGAYLDAIGLHTEYF